MGIKHCIRAAATPFFKHRRCLSPEIENIDVTLKGLPDAFDGFRIAVIADLHLPDCLSAPSQLIDALQKNSVDCILLAGDMTNRYHGNIDDSLSDFLHTLVTLAPTYAVAGNHERMPAKYAQYKEMLEKANVPLLCEQFTALKKEEAVLPLYGVLDPHLPLPKEVPSPAILLIHYPHRAAKAAKSGFALAVSGHAHGGLVRLGKHGLFAPGQGFFAKYVSGLYKLGEMQLVVSRGLGDSSLPIRVFNRPHLPIITLHKA